MKSDLAAIRTKHFPFFGKLLFERSFEIGTPVVQLVEFPSEKYEVRGSNPSCDLHFSLTKWCVFIGEC